jgi:stearoyl-CoA desaturase (delta-9 desaturase)
MAGQGSALRWSFDHRIHHAYVDTDKDPYSIKKGFWYAHFLWILEKPQTIDPKVVPDLISNKRVMFQHRYSSLLMVATNVIVFLAVSLMTGDYWGAFFLACWTRLFALHHFTWFINSLAHTWGDKPFSQEQSAVNNYVISLLTFGEGYHNYHHTFANDYRNGIRWYHFDPTKWLIWTLSKLGMAHGLKRIDALAIKKRMVMERKNILLDNLSRIWSENKQEWEKQVQDVSSRLMEHISSFSLLMKKYDQLKNTALNQDLLKEVKGEIKALKKSLKTEWKSWSALSQRIMQLSPAHR